MKDTLRISFNENDEIYIVLPKDYQSDKLTQLIQFLIVNEQHLHLLYNLIFKFGVNPSKETLKK